MMRKRAHRRDRRALLSSTLGSGRDEQSAIFSPVGAGLPLFAGGVPEGFPLGGEVAVAGRDAKEESVVLLKLVGGDLGNGGGFGRGVHLGKDFGREGLGDSVRSISATAPVLNISSYSAEDLSEGRHRKRL